MTVYALDANVLVSVVLPGGRLSAREFLRLTTPADLLIGSQLLLAECTSALRSEVFGRRISHSEAEQYLTKILELPLDIPILPQIYPRALDLARLFQHKKAYDMQYLALAESTEAELVTMDRSLRHAANQVGIPVRFLE